MELQPYPTLDIVHLSIGGNDFLQARPSSPLDALPIEDSSEANVVPEPKQLSLGIEE